MTAFSEDPSNSASSPLPSALRVFYFFFSVLYFLARWVFISAMSFTLVVATEAALLHCSGLWVCGLHSFRHTGSVAPRHVGTTQTRDRARVHCVGSADS